MSIDEIYVASEIANIVYYKPKPSYIAKIRLDSIDLKKICENPWEHCGFVEYNLSDIQSLLEKRFPRCKNLYMDVPGDYWRDPYENEYLTRMQYKTCELTGYFCECRLVEVYGKYNEEKSNS